MAASLIGLRAKNFQACITTKKPQMQQAVSDRLEPSERAEDSGRGEPSRSERTRYLALGLCEASVNSSKRPRTR